MRSLFAASLALTRDLFDLFAPPRCAACDDPFPVFPPAPLRPSLCAACADALEPAESPPPFVLTPYALGGPLERAILRAKFGDSPALARRLAPLLAHGVAGLLPAIDLVVPVPLHAQRLAARGFNQATELARALGRPVAHGAVARVRDTPSQRGLDRARRHANVRDAFAPARPGALRGLRVLVVDDVVTTGATLAGVAGAARAAGARTVACAALARTPLGH